MRILRISIKSFTFVLKLANTYTVPTIIAFKNMVDEFTAAAPDDEKCYAGHAKASNTLSGEKWRTCRKARRINICSIFVFCK